MSRMPPEIGGGPVSHQQIYAVSNYAGKPRAILTVAASPRSHVLARARSSRSLVRAL